MAKKRKTNSPSGRTRARTETAAEDPNYVRPPSWFDKHGRPELRAPRSFATGAIEPRVTPPPEGQEDTERG